MFLRRKTYQATGEQGTEHQVSIDQSSSILSSSVEDFGFQIQSLVEFRSCLAGLEFIFLLLFHLAWVGVLFFEF